MDEAKFLKTISCASKNTELKKYTTINLGGNAKYFVVAKSIKELSLAVASARNFGVPYRVLGFGSNVLISDKGFDGLVIVNRASSVEIDKSRSIAVAHSGTALSKLILNAGSSGLSGLEPLYGIPGTVGGAISVNAGAHNTSIGKFIKSATLMISADKIVSVSGEWFDFKYRSSRLKYKKDDFPPVVLSCTFQFQKRREKDILDEIAKYNSWREAHQPIGEKTCGSVFRNPSSSDANETKQNTAGYLLDESGAKKMKVGGIKVSKKHANWIINDGKATSFQARKLIDQMREAVMEKFSIELEKEIEYIGDWS